MHQLILKNFALHISLEPVEQIQALTFFQTKAVKKRTWLLKSGDTERAIYFVKSGCLRMFYADRDGEEHIIGFYPENWWVCDIVSFFKEKPSSNAIQASEDSEVYYASLAQLENLFLTVPKFERFFRILTQNGFELSQRRMTSQLHRTAEERYHEFRKQYPGLEQRIPQKHIAGYLGITPVFLSRLRKKS